MSESEAGKVRERPRYRKAWGQHHLTRVELCNPAVAFLEPAGRTILEIGPGSGVLTLALVQAGARVVAVERDPAWAFHLALGMRAPSLRLWVGDALQIAWQRLPRSWLVAGNLPYQIATVLIERLLDPRVLVTRAAFLVQREVAERLAASPGSRTYGALSVLVQARFDVQILGRVAPGGFRPPPKVESAFVGLARRQRPLLENWQVFRATTHAAFRHRRKSLRNSLVASWGRDEAHRVLALAQIDGSRRAETLTVDEVKAMSQLR